MIDESTDIGAVKTMCVVVRYYCALKRHIVSRFWNLIQIHGKENSAPVATATAQHLFETVIKSFEENSIPIENIIGFGSDGCNTMMGCHNSVSNRFRAKCPGIIALKCVCHSLHLCASDACKQLPAECEKLTRDIYNYFATSSKIQSLLKVSSIHRNRYTQNFETGSNEMVITGCCSAKNFRTVGCTNTVF